MIITASAVLLWWYMRPRTIRVWVLSDYSFRERRNWGALLDSRFREVNRIFSGTGVAWRVVNEEHLDPTAQMTQLDARRFELERSEEAAADVVVSVSGQGEGLRLGSASPFSHAALVVDFPQQSETQNALNLAHELALLFGAPVDPATSGTVMAVPPQNGGFSPKTAALIRELRGYDFAAGISALTDRWEHKAVEAIAGAYTRPSPKPLAYAHVTVALAFQAERHSGDAIPEAREAIIADPQSVDARQALAHALMDDLQSTAAARELREALKVFPQNASLHGFLGTVLGAQANTDEALDELHTAEGLDPKNANYPVAVGTVLVAQTERVDEAMAEFQKAVQLDPHNLQAQNWLHRMNDLIAQARTDLETDRRKERETPLDPTVHYRLGMEEARLGHRDNSRQELQKAVELDPYNGHALSDLAALDYYAHDYAAARRHIDAARATGFDPPLALVNSIDRAEKPMLVNPIRAK